MAGAYGDDNYQPQSYQDDLNTDESVTDPAMEELTENIAEEIGVDEKELGAEIDKYTDEDFEEDAQGDRSIDIDESEDRGSLIEDMNDENGGLPANDR